MNDFRLVSVVIPAYNSASYITETLVSVINQSYTNIEIICVNDCSTDDTLNVVKYFREQIERDIHFEVISLKANSKTAAARNKGIRESNGYFILPLDSDDCIDSHYIEKAVQIFASNPKVGVVYCKARQFGDVNENWYLPPFCPDRIVKRNMVHSAGLFRKNDWIKYGGYDERLVYGLEDWDFWLKFVEDNQFFFQIPEYLLSRRVLKNSRSSLLENKRQLKESLGMIRKSHKRLIWRRKLSRLRRSIFQKSA